MTEVIRKPIRLYPLPRNIRELDYPWTKVVAKRHHRVNPDKEGYSLEEGDNPMVSKPARSKSNLLSDM